MSINFHLYIEHLPYPATWLCVDYFSFSPSLISSPEKKPSGALPCFRLGFHLRSPHRSDRIAKSTRFSLSLSLCLSCRRRSRSRHRRRRRKRRRRSASPYWYLPKPPCSLHVLAGYVKDSWRGMEWALIWIRLSQKTARFGDQSPDWGVIESKLCLQLWIFELNTHIAWDPT